MIFYEKQHSRDGYAATPIVFALIPVALFAGFLFFSQIHHTAATPDIKPINIEQITQDSSSTDSDNDGLKDWEEQIYGTNPHDADTDGDGTKDGEEITQGRDPLKSNTSKDAHLPNDYLTQKTAAAHTSTDTSGSDQNLTQQFSEIFGREYLIKLVQHPDQQPDLNSVSDSMVQAALDKSAILPPPITIKDIVVSHGASADDINLYLRKFDAILFTALKPIKDNKSLTDIVADAVTDETSDAAENELTARINAYNQFLKNIKPLPVPEDFTFIHISYLNTVVQEREAMQKVKDAKHDIALAIIAVRELSQTNEEFDTLHQKFIDLGKARGVFSQKK